MLGHPGQQPVPPGLRVLSRGGRSQTRCPHGTVISDQPVARLGATSSAGGRQPGVPSIPGSTRRLRLVVAAAARQTDTQTTISIMHEAERRGFPTKNCSRWPRTTGPNPGCTPEPGGPSNAGWSAAPAGYGPTGHAARPSAWSSSCVGRDRAAGVAPSAAPSPHHAQHQHQHDHDDQHPQPRRHCGLLGRRRASSR
jgi:hypothetical protein